MKAQPASGKTTFRCTKGASKQRRDSLNTEISQIRECLPVSESLRHQLSQIQVMSLAAAYVHNASHLTTLFGCDDRTWSTVDDFDFIQALPGFLLLITPEDKLLYISDNVADYLGYSSIDLLTHGGTVYDIISEADRNVLKNVLECSRNEGQESVSASITTPSDAMKSRTAADKVQSLACRMKVSRSVRRQSSCDRYKLIYIRGHFIPYPQQSPTDKEEQERKIFVGFCSPQPYTQPQESTMFTTKHSMDMKYSHLDENAEYHLGYCRSQLEGRSWYALLHPEDVQHAKEMHLQVAGGVMSGSVCVRMQTAYGHLLALSVLIQPCKTKASQYFICSNRVMSAEEAAAEWIPELSATAPIIPELNGCHVSCNNSFTKLLYDKNLDESLPGFDLVTYDMEATCDDGGLCVGLAIKTTDFVAVDCRQLAAQSPKALCVPPVDKPSVKPACISKTPIGDRYPVLSQMLRAGSHVCVSSQMKLISMANHSLPPSPSIQSVLTPSSRSSSIISTCNLENPLFQYPSTPHSVASVDSSHSSRMEISENETSESDYVYLNIVPEERPYAGHGLLPELDSAMLDNCLWDDLSASESGESCIESMYEPMQLSDECISNGGVVPTCVKEEKSVFISRLSNTENSARVVEKQEVNSPAAINSIGSPGSPVENDLKEKCIADRRMECLLNLVRTAMASGLISADAIGKSGNGLVSLGHKLKELKRLHQRAMSRVNS